MNELTVFFESRLLTGIEPTRTDRVDPSWKVEVFYDGDCPLCRKEIAILRWMDRRKRVLFTDISSPDFRPAPLGRTIELLMAEIHGRLPNGEWITGVEVFRRIYSAIGFGIFVWPTRLPLIRHLLDFTYVWFAKNRLRLTGRCDDNCQVEVSQEKVSL